ncbi:MAG: ATP-binding protein, partial [Gammaproteobacteria bacterium]|nr:ATP-binding protein [Gammaproteobacteria bacterium]
DPFIYAVIEAWLSGKPRQNYDYLQSPIEKSRLIENLVALKLSSNANKVYFYKGENEIDFVLEHGASNTYLIEVKYQNRVVPDDYKHLCIPSYHPLLITKHHFKKNDGVWLLPVEYFLLCELNH